MHQTATWPWALWNDVMVIEAFPWTHPCWSKVMSNDVFSHTRPSTSKIERWAWMLLFKQCFLACTEVLHSPSLMHSCRDEVRSESYSGKAKVYCTHATQGQVQVQHFSFESDLQSRSIKTSLYTYNHHINHADHH